MALSTVAMKDDVRQMTRPNTTASFGNGRTATMASSLRSWTGFMQQTYCTVMWASRRVERWGHAREGRTCVTSHH